MATEAPPDAPPDEDPVRIEADGIAITSERAAQYQEWVERMHAKRERNRKQMGDNEQQDAPSYWRAEHVFADRDHGSGARPTPSAAVVQELLGVLGLAGQPSIGEIEAAFRRLAKVHHPDRHVTADDATREYHLEQMRRINDAYAQLRQLELT